jgi:hypothetical protein
VKGEFIDETGSDKLPDGFSTTRNSHILSASGGLGLL